MYRTLVLVAVVVVVADTSLTAQQATARAAAGVRTSASSSSAPTSVPRLLPGTKVSVLASIQGSALSSVNGPMVNTLMRLRDARFGRVVDTTITDKSGLFAFGGIDPGSYVIEMMDVTNEQVVAASPVIFVGSGEAESTVVKLPFRISGFAGLLGHTTPSALLVSSAAAASGVLAESVAGAPATDRALPGQ